MSTLKQTLRETLTTKRIEDEIALPAHIVNNLNPSFSIRDYQKLAFQYYLAYNSDEFRSERERRAAAGRDSRLLFHMATGSGKTLIMAGLILHLYAEGYRNFLFFVNSSNIIEKTKMNFLSPSSGKYLFAPQIKIGGDDVEIREVRNFQGEGSGPVINIAFTTIQGLHKSLNESRENSLTKDDFARQKIVLLSDEAHHINAETKKGESGKLSVLDAGSWENTVRREIFPAHPDNVLLEFTATVDFDDVNLAKAHNPHLIFDYPLREFREDGYSKDVIVVQNELPAFDRALQAVLLSQYRLKLFAAKKQHVKPVVLFKSKTIKESVDFHKEFIDGIRSLNGKKITHALAAGDERVRSFACYLEREGISPDSIAAELKEEFSEEMLIEVNSKAESYEKQIAVNTLEDKGNKYRAVFAVDKLNEGWDVLNLFDIVRMYETERESKATTMSEAQLIGRGARYCPFFDSDVLIEHSEMRADMRKYDNDMENPYRLCEELVYHSIHAPRYIEDLRRNLKKTGAMPDETRRIHMRLKEGFKVTSVYREGVIFRNRRQKRGKQDAGGMDESIKNRTYEVGLPERQSESWRLWGGDMSTPLFSGSSNPKHRKAYILSDLGIRVLREAMWRIDSMNFPKLQKLLPRLSSTSEFLTSPEYAGGINVAVSGERKRINDLSQDDKLHVASVVLGEVGKNIAADFVEYKGSHEFYPSPIREIFKDKVLNFSMRTMGCDAERGLSMNDEGQTRYHLDLSNQDWYVFNDNYGTSEEKQLIRYIASRHDELSKKYSEVYLIRNEGHFEIYSFDDGRSIQPDFILYLVGKVRNNTTCYQIFIEPKGAHLSAGQEWKERFLLLIKEKMKTEKIYGGHSYEIWGLPFYNQETENTRFREDFNLLVNPTDAPKNKTRNKD